MDHLKEFLEQCRHVRAVWMPFCVALGAASLIIWQAVNWRYGGAIDHANHELAKCRDGSADTGTISAADRARLAALSPRELNANAGQRMADLLRLRAGESYTVLMYHDPSCQDCRQYERQFAAAFLSASGWKVTRAQGWGPPAVNTGVIVRLRNPSSATPAEQLVITALRGAEIPFRTDMREGSNFQEDVLLEIGDKPAS